MIYLSEPHVSGREQELIKEAFLDNDIRPAGKMLDLFEGEFANRLGATNPLAVSNATAAMHLALRCLGLGEGDIVWTSSLTFIGGVAPITYIGAIPVFLDCAESSWTMDCDLLEAELKVANARNKLPSAIVPVDLYGQSCDIDKLEELAQQYEIRLIFDSAEVLGATYRGRPAGTGGDASVHSFNGNKMITASGGGMLLSKDRFVRELAFKLSTQAKERTENSHYCHNLIGYNYRMSNIMAAIGLGQLETLNEKVRLRRNIFERYKKGLSDIEFLNFMPEAAYGTCSRWLTVLTLNDEASAWRDELLLHLRDQSIEARPVWKPMHMQPVFDGSEFKGSGVCEGFYRSGICLPSSSGLTLHDQDVVVRAIRSFLLGKS